MNKKPTATVKIKINDMEKEITVPVTDQ